MNVKEIQEIINFIKKTDLDDVSIETENYKIRAVCYIFCQKGIKNYAKNKHIRKNYVWYKIV